MDYRTRGSQRLAILLRWPCSASSSTHLLDERFDCRRGSRSRHHRQRCSVRDCVGGPGVGRIHFDREQGRRSGRAAGRTYGSAVLHNWRVGDGSFPESAGDRHLGHHWRPGGFAAAAGHAVPDHGNFEGAAQKRAYALVGGAAAIAAAVGPLLGGFITTLLSWRIAFLLEVVIIGVVLSSSCAMCRTPDLGKSTSWRQPSRTRDGQRPADPDRAPRDLRLARLPALVICDVGLGVLVSQLKNYTLAPISDER